MKKIIPTACLTILAGVLLFVDANSSENVKTLTFLNVEALAETESSKYTCYGLGSLDCPQSEDKVKFIR